MQLIGHIIVRLVSISIGLLLGILAAAIFLSLGILRDVLDPALGYPAGTGGVLVPWIALIASPFVAASVLGPALIVIAVAELMHWRSMIANLALGGLIALFVGWQQFVFQGNQSISDGALVVLLAAGFIAGFAYWLVAGRSAGNWNAIRS
jgi:hypothetical protein